MHDRGGFNFLHMHEGSLLSGGFYLQVPAGSGQFVFRDPRPGVIQGSVKGGVPNGHADVHLTPERGPAGVVPVLDGALRRAPRQRRAAHHDRVQCDMTRFGRRAVPQNPFSGIRYGVERDGEARLVAAEKGTVPCQK